jgi:hypothetical protein
MIGGPRFVVAVEFPAGAKREETVSFLQTSLMKKSETTKRFPPGFSIRWR